MFTSRKMLEAGVKHSTIEKWDTTSSIPFNDADARTISDLEKGHPIVWSDDSSTVSYWINKQRKDSMTVELTDRQFKFKRDLYSLSVTHTFPEKDE